MNVFEVLRVFQRYWAMIVALVALGVSAGALSLLVANPAYDATARVFVSTQSLGTADELLQGSTYTQARMLSYAQVASDPIVLDPVIERLGLDTTPGELSEQVSATAQNDELIIEITVQDGNPTDAATIVNEIAAELSSVVTEQIEAPVAGGDALVSVTSLRTAEPPASPSWPVPWLALAVGGGAGLILGAGLAFLLHSVDSRVRNLDELKRLVPLPVLGMVMRERRLTPQGVMGKVQGRSMFAESYRTLRANLQFIDAQGLERRTLLVTSTIPGEGKSTAATGLAAALAEAGHAVALVDADLRKPQVASMLGLEGGVGLTDVLLGEVSLAEVFQAAGPEGRVHVLSAGRIPPNPAELLESELFGELVDALAAEYDYVIVDSPPVLPVADAAVLSKVVDGVLMVVAVEHVRRPQLETGLASLERAEAPLIGVVANRLARVGVDAYSYYAQGYASVGEGSPGGRHRKVEA